MVAGARAATAGAKGVASAGPASAVVGRPAVVGGPVVVGGGEDAADWAAARAAFLRARWVAFRALLC